MHMDKFENAFLWLAGITLGAFAIAVLISVAGLGIHLPGEAGQIAPADVATDPDFGAPGLRSIRPGDYELYIVASTWQYDPSEVEVPVNSHVTLFLTSPDVIHGFKVFNTTLNGMVIPGQITQLEYTFKKPGTYAFYCHEYCGTLHHTMIGQIVVTGDNQ